MKSTISIPQNLLKFVNEDAKQIEGWFFNPDIFSFIAIFETLKNAGATGDVVEIGVYHAKSLALLSLLKKEQQKLWGFDFFPGDRQTIAEENLSKYGRTDTVELIKCFTSEFTTGYLDKLLNTPVSFLHVDAGHEYHEVLAQMKIFAPYLSDQAIIAMDDYQDREFPGVGAAVLDFCEMDRPRRFVPFFAGGNKMYLCSPTFSETYQLALLECNIWDIDWRITQVKDYQILIPFSKVPMSKLDVKQSILKNFHPRKNVYDEENLEEKYAQLKHMEVSKDIRLPLDQ